MGGLAGASRGAAGCPGGGGPLIARSDGVGRSAGSVSLTPLQYRVYDPRQRSPCPGEAAWPGPEHEMSMMAHGVQRTSCGIGTVAGASPCILLGCASVPNAIFYVQNCLFASPMFSGEPLKTVADTRGGLEGLKPPEISKCL